MSKPVTELSEFASGWRGVSLVAITYVYFLIFAQFAFLNRLSQLGIADAHLQGVMAAMAIGGILSSLLTATLPLGEAHRLRLQISFLVCGTAAALSLLRLDLAGSITVSFLIGSGLGVLTVTLVSNLRLWLGSGDGLLKVGLGTGLGYFICNFPPLFTGGPGAQAITAAALCLLGILAASKTRSSNFTDSIAPPTRSTSFPCVLIAFTALVWLDSAAFFIIQNTPSLKAGTWEGTFHMWANGLIHLSAAVLSAFLLRRRGLPFVLGAAVIVLSIACLLLHQPGQAVLASIFYPIGVSLYSVALVAYPSLLAYSTSAQQRACRAGLIYAVAGWFGSAMGIGMGQHLRQVPLLFVLLSASLVLGPSLLKMLRYHRREAGLVVVGLCVALCVRLTILSSTALHPVAATSSAIERGRYVYLSEGCINCHSQYVRPRTSEVLMWGPTETIKELRLQHPPLIGNRRQGPDLSQVGGRRSTLWLKAHLLDPREVSPASFMPSYAYLFTNSQRGDDLVQYLDSLKSPEYAQHIALEQAWQPAASGLSETSSEQGARLFGSYCATCHEANGATRQTWASSFKRLPPDLLNGPWVHIKGADSNTDRELHLAQIIKFGIPETDMPGHEYLSDNDISSIALWLNQHMVSPRQPARIQNTSGDAL